jgi:glycosyltransferase involved in cell wall biosynthesis
MKVIAVIPAYNEAPRIGATLLAVKPHVDGIVVVDDGSVDETVARAAAAGVTVLQHRINRGQGAALKTGTIAALRLGADIIVHVDADGQHDPTFIDTVVKPLKEGSADVVFGSRFLGVTSGDMPLVRRTLLTAARSFNALFVGIPRRVTDPQSGMRAFSRMAATQVDFREDRMAHCSEILRLVTRSPLRWVEVPIRVRYTSETLAKGQKSRDALKIVWQLFIGAFRR